jgi:ABC-type polysaccharide/polyol phosphate transport system ATPase subunit
VSAPDRPTVIELSEVGKRYLRQTDGRTLASAILPGRTKGTEHWAVQDLDLSLRRGDTVGILGHNGAGKTTLLRLLAGVTRPSRGRVRIVGRIAPLISVGVGFHQEMTGRENVALNGLLLGRTKEQVAADFDAIVDFSGLTDVLDTPVKFYSTGMLMRLGFSVAMFSRPDVLLIDEVLAVGDAGFQLKCIERMQELQAGGATVVIVSHSVHVIRLMCPRAIVMHAGRKVFDGPAEEAVSCHHELLGQTTAGALLGTSLEVVERELVDEHGNPPVELEQGRRYTLRYRIRFLDDTDSPQAYLTVTSTDGVLAYHMISALGRPYRRFRAGEETVLEMSFTSNLAGGTYRLAGEIRTADGAQVLWTDTAGLLAYRPPSLGTVGVTELDATISVGGDVINEHSSLLLGDERP